MNPITRIIEKRFMAPARRMKQTQFEELAPAGGEIVFLGDSITEGGAWHEWFPTVRVLNRGIDGDTTDGVLARLGTALRSGPSAVFLLIGTNDLALKRPREQTRANVDEIVRLIRDEGRGPEVVLQSVMPRQERFRPRVEELNREYQEIASRRGARYLDLWPALADAHGALNSQFTLDGLHLTGAGYRAWTTVLEPLVLTHREARP
ncbi:GDSL-type esterase/lipase family protein [Herbiconiux liangxiaofengii]|uniref:GDSL-type esterase/lipase family protein n=1 Tax=Herbiconiux liangxiaofengii TaxID=3342795 RepID=UPI0035B7CEF4